VKIATARFAMNVKEIIAVIVAQRRMMAERLYKQWNENRF
jgi:hypothetical protein